MRQALGVMVQGGIGAKRGLAADTWRSILADVLATSIAEGQDSRSDRTAAAGEAKPVSKTIVR